MIMQLNKLASWSIIISFVFALLILGKNLIIPFIIALLVWYIIVSLSQWIGKFPMARKYFPNWLKLSISSLIIIGLMAFVGEMVANNATLMANTLPKYESRLNSIVSQILSQFGMDQFPNVSSIFEQINVSNIISEILSTFSGFASNALIIVIYLMFIFTEQAVFTKKMKALFTTPASYAKYEDVVGHINEAIIKYLSVKSVVSILTAALSYLIMVLVGVDFAIFWAFLIFLLNFIPNIGSIVATLFPALLTLVQFDHLTPFFIIIFGVGAVQMIVGNVIEPRMMGDSLNISPLVVIIALSLWGALWGLTGMVLSVPITVIIIIILAQFKETRPMAILLSLNGVPGYEEEQ